MRSLLLCLWACQGGPAGKGREPSAAVDSGASGGDAGLDGGGDTGHAEGGPADGGGDSGASEGDGGAGDSAADGGSAGDGSADDGSAGDSGGAGDSGAPWSLPERPDVDSPALGESWRWGGGQGYPDMVDPTWPVVTRISDLAGLEAAVAAAAAGDILWVEDEAEIDLTGRSICLPEGVWLAGGRGQGGPGGLLYTTAGSSTPMIQACGHDVRITGLRLRGPDPESCPPEWPSDCPEDVSGDPNCAYCTQTAYGVGTRYYDRLEVDNNDLSGWTYAAVGVRDALDADLHHNHIHHGWREGLGYGLVIYGSGPASALIRWNRFDAMRHVVAGQGYPSEDYEARDNLMGERAISHIYDMHGQDEALDDGSSYAGGQILVHRNIVLAEDEYSFVVRGRPDVGAWFYDNCVAPAEGEAVLQRYFTGNLYVDEDPSGASAPNAYGQSPADCGTQRWCLADGLVGPQRYGSISGTGVSLLKVGDMDGDGRDDVFTSDSGRWEWAHPDGGSWAALASSGVSLSQLALVDLDGDGTDDVFRASGSEWSWSRSGLSSWASLKDNSHPLSELRFGDFDGDGAIDVFTTDGGRWYHHPRGSGAAVAMASSSDAIEDLAVGDFDGDGLADVFGSTGSRWRWSRSGTSSWADLASSGVGAADLALADVDGDGVTDVIYAGSERLMWSEGGRGSWAVLRHQSEGLAELLLGDFNGDGQVDLLTSGCL